MTLPKSCWSTERFRRREGGPIPGEYGDVFPKSC